MKKINLFATACALPIIAAAFNSNGWKKDGDGKLATDADGNPVYVQADGAEQSVTSQTIAQKNGEAKANRERAEKAETALKAFEGIDPAAARTALETVSKLDQKALIDAGEVDKVKDQLTAQFNKTIDDTKADNEKLKAQVDNLTLGRALDGSKFIAENVAVPRDMFVATFGQNFKVVDGKIVAYDGNGNPINAPGRMGDHATVDEALQILVAAHPHKDAILKAKGTGGTGNPGNAGNGKPGVKSITRAEYDAMPHDQKATTGQALAKGELQIVNE